jgi:hypothetical protein
MRHSFTRSTAPEASGQAHWGYNPDVPLTLLRLLVVAIALVVPIQGMTAVMAGQCMAFGHHQDGGSEDHSHVHDGADGSQPAEHSHTDDAAAKQGDASDKNSHCGPCTACCASASIAGPARLSILSLPSPAQYHFSQLPPPGVQPHGLDRPPLAL